MTATFTVLYQLPSGWWTAGTFATHAEAVASAAADEARTGWTHRVVTT